ncbi:uncharacterized protein LOC111260480 isoform X1 [Varroa jacobsoni]|uniref:uncharacterized protein LOC111260480 isoform X1 n=1 Tax=Varroa jacobsoni TaxID=62625 RepID=UPI000BF64C8E|nr:uncharacterized protein LOC111260480 isoform X1 [Varroa jacobsoni]
MASLLSLCGSQLQDMVRLAHCHGLFIEEEPHRRRSVLAGLVMLATALVESLADKSCLPKNVLLPLGCRCYSGPRITCKGAKDSSTVDQIVKTIGNVALKELNLSEATLTSLPTSVCEINVEELVLSHSKLRSLGRLTNCNFSSFSLDNTTIEKADKMFRSLREVPALMQLSFLRMELDLNDIGQLSHLLQLNFYKCNFTLGNYLRPLNSLIELQIVESNIKSIMLKRDQLPDSPDELKLLRIIGLGLHSLPENLLMGMTLLQKLDISKNHLVDLQESGFISFHGTLIMQGNPWHCDDLVWLRRRAAAGSIRLFNSGRVACATPPGTHFDQIQLPKESQEEKLWKSPLHHMALTNRGDFGFPMTLCFVVAAIAALGLLGRVAIKKRQTIIDMNSNSLCVTEKNNIASSMESVQSDTGRLL